MTVVLTHPGGGKVQARVMSVQHEVGKMTLGKDM